MAKLKVVGPEAKSRLQNTSKSYEERAPYREAISNINEGQMLELEPDAGESMRRLKLLARKAGSEAGREIQYGETEQGSLLVWLAERSGKRRRTSVD
jgi:hypothetical protein